MKLGMRLGIFGDSLSLLDLLKESEINMLAKCRVLGDYDPLFKRLNERYNFKHEGNNCIILGGLRVNLNADLGIESLDLVSLHNKNQTSRLTTYYLTHWMGYFIEKISTRFKAYDLTFYSESGQGFIIIANGDVIKGAYGISKPVEAIEEVGGLILIKMSGEYYYLDKEILYVVDSMRLWYMYSILDSFDSNGTLLLQEDEKKLFAKCRVKDYYLKEGKS